MMQFCLIFALVWSVATAWTSPTRLPKARASSSYPFALSSFRLPGGRQPPGGQSNGGPPYDGQYYEGQPNGGQPYDGQYYEGQPNGLRSSGGQPNGRQSYGGQPNGGQSYGGQQNGGQSYGGQQNGGQSYGGQQNGGQSYGGQQNGGQSYGGQPNGGKSYGRRYSGAVPGSVRRLQDVVCLVTGASRGIGKGIAIELGREGAIVYVTGTSTTGSVYPYHQSLPYVTSEECGGPGTIEETAAAVTAAGGFGISLYCNHAVDADVKNVMDVIASRHGRLDILINNVFRLPPGGAAQLKKKFWEQGPAVWDCVHTVGLRSHYVASCYAMPLLLASKIRQQGGFLPRPFIGMISSFGGMSYTFNVPYGVGKAGVDRLAKDMAVELEEFDICVTSLYPGLVNTERTQASVANGEWGTHVGLPLDNAETPAFTGRAVVALATDRSNRKKYSGTVQVVAELAEKYGFTDIDGRRPPSIRSLRFLWHTYGMNDTQRKTISPQWLPNVKLPFWALSGGKATEKQK